MTEDESILQYEVLESEPNALQPCPQCDVPDTMILRDPNCLPDLSVFAYCPECGCTWTVRVLHP